MLCEVHWTASQIATCPPMIGPCPDRSQRSRRTHSLDHPSKGFARPTTGFFAGLLGGIVARTGLLDNEPVSFSIMYYDGNLRY